MRVLTESYVKLSIKPTLLKTSNRRAKEGISKRVLMAKECRFAFLSISIFAKHVCLSNFYMELLTL